MAWIESHQELERHPKTLHLMCLMGWDLDTTIGKLHRFWWWCVDYAEDGNLGKYNDAVIASSVALNGDQGKQFVKAMITSCWIDQEPYFRVHDWWDYIGLFLQRKYGNKNPDKWKKIREAYKGCTPSVQKGVPQLAQPNLTKPNLTKPKEKELVQKPPPISDKPKRASTVPDDEWINSLRENPAYKNLDIGNVFGKMTAWCELKGLKPTRRRLLNWLNSEEAPLAKSKPKSRIEEINHSLRNFL